MSSPHDREGDAAAAAVGEFYGKNGTRRRWDEDELVLFYHQGQVSHGHVMRAEYGVERDTYFVRKHITGGGTEIVEVLDRAMLIY